MDWSTVIAQGGPYAIVGAVLVFLVTALIKGWLVLGPWAERVMAARMADKDEIIQVRKEASDLAVEAANKSAALAQATATATYAKVEELAESLKPIVDQLSRLLERTESGS